MGAADRLVTIPYAPRPLQRDIHEQLDRHRWSVIVCHRRFGKTVLAVNQLIKAAALCPLQRPRFAYIAPTYKQGKAIAWDYLKHYSAPIPGVEKNESELWVQLPNEARVRIFGADNPDSLRGIYLDGVVLDEYGMMARNTFSEVLRPALSDRKGWAAFIGTPNGKNQFWEVAATAQTEPGWYYACHRASETGVVQADELTAARRMMTADEYDQEFECSFEASVKGAIYAAELQQAREKGRIRSVPYSPELPVHTYWDLGVGDATAIWFLQAVGSEVRLIDYHEASGEGLPYYKKILEGKGYIYGEHWAPHDIRVRELSTGRSREETARNLGLNFRTVPNQFLEDGIHSARMLLPRCYFDAEKCKVGLEALQNYRWDFNNRLQEYKATPVHDWASHGADAFRYLAIAWRPYTVNERSPEPEAFSDGI